MTAIESLKTHLAEQIALADKIGDCTVFMQSREDFIARNKERRQLQVALEEIENVPEALDIPGAREHWIASAIDRITEAGV